MFGFKRRVAERAVRDEADRADRESVQKAEELGRDFGREAIANIDHFIAVRARRVADDVYSIFSRLVDECRDNENASRIDEIRIQADIFIEQLGIFKDQMTTEAHTHLADWFSAADAMQGRDTLDNYLQSKVGEIYLELVERGANRAGSLIQALQAAGHKAILTANRDAAS